MKRALIFILVIPYSICALAFKTHFVEVDFKTNQVTHNGQIYALIETKQQVKTFHREINYYCISESCGSIVFRLYVNDNGKITRFIKFNSKK